MSFDVEGWDRLLDEIGGTAVRWLSVIEELIDERSDHDEVMSVSRGPLPAVLSVGGERLRKRAIEWAETESKRVAALFNGLALALSSQGDGESLAVHALGLTVVADACARQATQPAKNLGWDLWTVDLAIQMTDSNPQFRSSHQNRLDY
jgi:hypothetical protein